MWTRSAPIDYSREKSGQYRQSCAIGLFSISAVLPEAVNINYFSIVRNEDELVEKTLLLAESIGITSCSTFSRNWLTDPDLKHRETLRAYIGLSFCRSRERFRWTVTSLESLSAASNRVLREFPTGQSRLLAFCPGNNRGGYSQNDPKSVQYCTVILTREPSICAHLDSHALRMSLSLSIGQMDRVSSNQRTRQVSTMMPALYQLFYRVCRLMFGLVKKSPGNKPRGDEFAPQRMCPFCGLITPRSNRNCLECGKSLKPA